MRASDFADFASALAEKGRQPETAFAALCALTAAVVGVKLFTIMAHDAKKGIAQRIYSNMPEPYPVSGTKPANPTDWSRQVIEGQQTFVANDIKAISAVFGDFELIRSLGCESVMNVPIVIDGAVLGTINCLHEAGFYTGEKIKAAEALKTPGAVCLLLNERNSANGAR
ncbi:MAG: GAF domain-containing protein [Cucumibacter sp.]